MTVRRKSFVTCLGIGAAATLLGACGGRSSDAGSPSHVVGEPGAVVQAQAQSCSNTPALSADPLRTAVAFEAGPAYIEASEPHGTYHNNVGWLWGFLLVIYPPRDVDDQAVTISGRHILSGAPILFESFVRARSPGPLTLRTGGDNVTVSPVTAYVTELGIYDITLTGDRGHVLGTTRVAICSSFVVLGSP